jgi:hypothetical protein
MSRSWKTSVVVGVDRISEFPDPVLVHILSFLSTKEAIRTQVLSKRWRFLWTYIPILVFGQYSCGSECTVDSDIESCYGYNEERCTRFRNRDFVIVVDATLNLSNCSKLKKLGISFAYKPCLAPKVNLWFRFAVDRGTEELHLEFFDGEYLLPKKDHYELPQHLYTNSVFRVLNFCRCRVTPKGDVAWKSLKKLSLGDVKLSDDLLRKILANSPVLEMLELYHYGGFSRLCVDNTNLKKLILRQFVGPTYEEDEAAGEYHHEDHEDEAEGEDHHEVDEVGGGNDQEVDEADGEEDESDGEHDSEGLIISAPYLQSLEISGRVARNCQLMDLSSLVDAKLACKLIGDMGGTEGFARIQARFKVLLSSFVHVKSLEVGTWAIQYSWPGKAELCNFKAEHYWTSQERTFKCLSLHLKKVVFADLSWFYEESHFYYFAQFLLKNAKVLQKMIICTLWLEDSVPKEIFEASKKLLGFPRTSPEAIVMFHKNPMAKWNISTFTPPPPWDNCFE